MRSDILKTIGKAKKISNLIILTHNIDFVFFQTVVLRRLKKCGNPVITIFADADCAKESYANQKPVIYGLGRRYRVVPVAMDHGFRFHPKAIFCSEEEKASLFVGSGNLTFGGWRENAEVWNNFNSETDGTAVFSAFKEYLGSLLNRLSNVNNIARELTEAFDPTTKIWAHDMAPSSGLIGKILNEKPIIEQIQDHLENTVYDRLIIQSPFFDENGIALNELANRFRISEIHLLAQNNYTELTSKIINNLPAKADVKNVTFCHNIEDGTRKANLHGKFYAFIAGNSVTVFSGSANCSRAALTADGRRGNGELLSVIHMSLAEFTQEVYNELEEVNSEFLPFVEKKEEESPKKQENKIARILSIQFDFNRLDVSFQVTTGYKVIGCMLDGEKYMVEPRESVLSITIAQPPTDIGLIVLDKAGDQNITKEVAWIDFEEVLGTTAKKRAFADLVSSANWESSFDTELWQQLAKAFKEHLDYNPASSGYDRGDSSTKDREGDQEMVFDHSDIFINTYEPSSCRIIPTIGRTVSIKQLLLQYLGLQYDTADDDEDVDMTQEELAERITETEIAESDRKNVFSLSPDIDIDEKTRKKVISLVKRMISTITNGKFIEQRPFRYLASDIKILALLLKIALQKAWMTKEEYFDTTNKVWVALFFPREDDNTTWLTEKLEQAAENRDNLILPELGSSLLVWRSAINDEQTLKYLRFHVSAIQVAARHPWLFSNKHADIIKNEIEKIIAPFAASESEREIAKLNAQNAWKEMVEVGFAFRAFEDQLQGKTIADFRERIGSITVPPGELLWQTRTYGINKYKFDRKNVSSDVACLAIREGADEMKVKAGYTVPVTMLLTDELVSIDSKRKEILLRFLNDIQKRTSSIREFDRK